MSYQGEDSESYYLMSHTCAWEAHCPDGLLSILTKDAGLRFAFEPDSPKL